jgi:hypothetical protein
MIWKTSSAGISSRAACDRTFHATPKNARARISQKMALNVAEAYASNPQVGEDRFEALLREGARVNAAVATSELAAEAGLAQLRGFAGEAMGLQEHLVNDGITFLRSGAGLSAEDMAAIETPGAEPADPAQAPAQPAPAPAAVVRQPLVDRDALRQTVARHESAHASGTRF